MTTNYKATLATLRGLTKSANQTAAVPEKDPNDKGSAPAPATPGNTPEKLVAPAAQPNNTVAAPPTPVVTPAATVQAPEKVAGLSDKVAGLRSTLSGMLSKSAKDIAPSAPGKSSPPSEAAATEEAPKVVTHVKAGEPAKPKDDKEQPAPKPVATAEVPDKPADKSAAGDEVIVPEDVINLYAKMAATAMEFREGRDMIEACLRQKEGIEAADNIIKAAAFMEEHMIALQQAELEGATEAEKLASSMTAEDLDVAQKLAAAEAYDFQKLTTPEEQEAYRFGATKMAAMLDAGAGEMEAPPEGYDAEQVTPEDIMQVIEYLLNEGLLSPEDAEKLVMELSQGGAAGAGDEAAMAQMPPEEKEAYVKAAAAEKTFDQLVETLSK